MAKILRIEVSKALTFEEVERLVTSQGGLIHRIDKGKDKTTAYITGNKNVRSNVEASFAKVGKIKKNVSTRKKFLRRLS